LLLLPSPAAADVLVEVQVANTRKVLVAVGVGNLVGERLLEDF